MAENDGGWLSRRKRKRRGDGGGGDDQKSKEPPPPPSTTANAATTSVCVPASLVSPLAWANGAKRRMRRNNCNWDRGSGVRKVAGKAIFFIHDPLGDDPSEWDQGKIWFQGRFFPSAGPTNGNTIRGGVRPGPPVSASYATGDSWGMLVVQNEIIDKCVCCRGGDPEVDLTFIRTEATTPKNGEKKARWTAEDVVWTGGNMMALSTDSLSPTLSGDKPGMKFEPQKLLEGDLALAIASRYFPSMTRRLRIHSTTNENDEVSEAMVLIGDMEVAAPASFAKMGNGGTPNGGVDSNDDGLWSD